MSSATSTNVTHVRRVAWPILICMGGISVTFCIYQAIHAGHMNPYLAVLAGFAPSAVAVGLSHVVAAHKGGWAEKIITGLVMTGAMILSAHAIAAVVAPAEGPELKWIFGGVLDTASMVALWVIFDVAGGSKAEATALEIAEQGARDAAARAERAEAERAAQASEAARLHAEFTAELDRTRAELTAEAEQARTDLAVANATVEALRSARVPARKSRRSSGRKPVRTTGQNQAGSTAPEADASTGPEVAQVPDASTGPEGELDMDQEARLLILDYVAKGHSASEAGRLAGKTDSYGRQVVRLAKAAKTEPAGGERSEGDVS